MDRSARINSESPRWYVAEQEHAWGGGGRWSTVFLLSIGLIIRRVFIRNEGATLARIPLSKSL